MSFAKVYGAQTHLLNGHIVTVEIDISRGLNNFTIVGLPDKAVEESRDRVSAAIKNSGFESPKTKNHKVVVSLAPAHLKKEGAVFDLAIALCYLLAEGEVHFEADKKLFLAELSLDGILRPINGILALVNKARDSGFEEIYVAKENVREAALIPDIKIYGADKLKQVVDHLKGVNRLPISPQTKITASRKINAVDLSDIKGQEAGKRALLIASAGAHNIALFGPAGTGKTMLARAFSSLLPDLTYEEIVEITSIHSIAGTLSTDFLTERPFRSPHHTSSYVALVGGGANIKPGEITLAHRGALFLDEFPEFDRRVMESLRQPLEDKVVSIARSKGSALFPANFILIAAMNPCPCGNLNSNKTCVCSAHSINQYQKKISGPIADRIDIWIEVPHIEHKKLQERKTNGLTSDVAKSIIEKAREFARNRTRNTLQYFKNNGELNVKEIEKTINLGHAEENFLISSADKLKLSPRSFHKTIKVARTIADLDQKDNIEIPHILEALQYRRKSN